MDKELIEDIARAIQRQYGKEMLGEIQKWEKRPTHERSCWRVIARTAINLGRVLINLPSPLCPR
jgi:hypothetical protein